MKSNLSASHDEIATLAHEIWECAGRPAEQATEIWLRAERELNGDRQQAGRFQETMVTSGSPPENKSSLPPSRAART